MIKDCYGRAQLTVGGVTPVQVFNGGNLPQVTNIELFDM